MKRTAILRRTPLRKVSSKRSRELREYSKKRKAFLEAHPLCQVWIDRNDFREIDGVFYEKFGGQIYDMVSMLRMGCPRSCDIHHKNKRHGERLNDETQWMAVSREAHCWIHENPKAARGKGWLV